MRTAITGVGLFTPEQSISNDELVESFNQYVDAHNAEHAEAIARGDTVALQHSSSEFIYKASGIKSRYCVDKAGVLDPAVMHPVIATRGNDAPSLMVEMGLVAAKQALANGIARPNGMAPASGCAVSKPWSWGPSCWTGGPGMGPAASWCAKPSSRGWGNWVLGPFPGVTGAASCNSVWP